MGGTYRSDGLPYLFVKVITVEIIDILFSCSSTWHCLRMLMDTMKALIFGMMFMGSIVKQVDCYTVTIQEFESVTNFSVSSLLEGT
ncbi:hypothetical protein GW17_00004103 [Ensete ventricosum]|nr:hypothetical protein GW17_00004103 [Ensete ventricosum]